MSGVTNYTEQFLAISANIGVHVNDPSTYVRLNWNIFNGIREEFKLNLPELKALVSAAQDNVLDPQYHSAFTILQAGKILTIEQALGEDKCGANYEIALSFRDAVPTYFCEIVGHNTCTLESQILNNFATLESRCISMPSQVPAAPSADAVNIKSVIADTAFQVINEPQVVVEGNADTPQVAQIDVAGEVSEDVTL